MNKISFEGKITLLALAFIFVCLNGGCAQNRLTAENRVTNLDINMSIQDNQNRNEKASVNKNLSSSGKTLKDVDKDWLITNTALGNIKVGMQMKELKKFYPSIQYKIVVSPLDDITSVIEATQKGEKLFYFTTDNFSEVEDVELPKETDKIFLLATNNPRFATAQGVKIGNTFSEAEKVYGKSERFTQPSSNFVGFKNKAVENIVFYLTYDKSENETKDFSPDAKITYISVGVPAN